MGGNLTHRCRQRVVLRHVEGVEFLVIVDCDDGQAALVVDADDWGTHFGQSMRYCE